MTIRMMPDTTARVATAPDPVALAQTYADASRLSVRPAPASSAPRSVFHSLFSADTRMGAVAAMVNALWTAPSHPPVAPAAVHGSGTLDLFRDQASDTRALFRRRV